MDESRLLWHISKGCKDKELKGHLYTNCPYNTAHIILKTDLNYHLRRCPDANKQEKMQVDLGISQDDIAAAIGKQFLKPKTNNNSLTKEEKSYIEEKNASIPGFAQQSDEGGQKKKRIRKKKEKTENLEQREPAKNEPDIQEWYEKSYGPYAQLLEKKKKNDESEINFEDEWDAVAKEFEEEEEKKKKLKEAMINDNSLLQKSSKLEESQFSESLGQLSIMTQDKFF